MQPRLPVVPTHIRECRVGRAMNRKAFTRIRCIAPASPGNLRFILVSCELDKQAQETAGTAVCCCAGFLPSSFFTQNRSSAAYRSGRSLSDSCIARCTTRAACGESVCPATPPSTPPATAPRSLMREPATAPPMAPPTVARR